MDLVRGKRVMKTLAFIFTLAAVVFIPLVLAFSQSVKQAEPAAVNQPVTWRFVLHASNSAEKGFSFPLPETASDVSLKTAGGSPVQFSLDGGKLVCASCDLSKQDYIIELKTPAPVLVESGWMKNEEASAAGQEFYSQKETVFNPSEFNYKNVQGFFVCGKEFICTVAANKGNPFFKIGSLKSKQGIDFIVSAVKTAAEEKETPAQTTPLIIPLEDYVKEQPSAKQMVEENETPALAMPSVLPVELPEIPELNETEAAALVNETPEYSFGLNSVTGNDFPASENASAWRVSTIENETTFKLDYSRVNSSGADPQTLFFKTHFYDSSNSGKTRVELAFSTRALCASCFAWLKVKTFDESLRELGENDVFFNSENVLSNGGLNVFLLKPIKAGGSNGTNQTGQANETVNETEFVGKLVAEFDSSNSSFERFYVTAYSLDGEFAGELEFNQPLVSIEFLEHAQLKTIPLEMPLEDYLALNQTNQTNSSA